MTVRGVAATLAALALLLSACAGSSDPAAPPKAVDPALAPNKAADDGVTILENEDDETRRAFADAGDRSLLADGRLWEIRRAERLIGTLQISTVVDKVDLTDERERLSIVRDVLVGGNTRIQVGETEVFTIQIAGQAIYVWFGVGLVEILTMKGFDGIEPESVLEDVIAHQAKVPAWEPLPVTSDGVIAGLDS